MKIKLIIIIALLGFGIQLQAQTKKATPKKATTAKTSPAKKTTTTVKKPVSTQTTKPVAAKTSANTQAAKPAPTPVYANTASTTKAVSGGTAYQTAVGVKFLYGLSVTAKHFLKPQHALEGIVRYRNYSGFGSEFNLTALYEYHNDINGAPGLKWYVGGGAYFGMFSYDSDLDAYTIYGPVGTLGLEYKFKKLPLAISADWQPVFTLNENGGFTAENGGIGVKYTF